MSTLVSIIIAIGERKDSQNRQSDGFTGSTVVAMHAANAATDALNDPKLNHLLAALPQAEWERWLPQLEAARCRWVRRSTSQVAR